MPQRTTRDLPEPSLNVGHCTESLASVTLAFSNAAIIAIKCFVAFDFITVTSCSLVTVLLLGLRDFYCLKYA